MNNIETFYTAVCKFEEEYEHRDLETYLLALYQNVLKHKEAEPTLELMHQLLSEAFVSEPMPFDGSWLQIEVAPDPNRISRKFTNPDISDAIDKTNESSLSGLEFTIAVLEFQIAELHKMRGKQLEDKYRYFGIASETGHQWYNFDPFANLECGARCMYSNEDDLTTIDWSFIGNLLEDGRIYE